MLMLRTANSEMTMDAMRDQDGSYYMTASQISKLWETEAIEQDGQLTMTVP